MSVVPAHKRKGPGPRRTGLEADPRGLISLRPHPPPIYSVPETFARPFGDTGFKQQFLGFATADRAHLRTPTRYKSSQPYPRTSLTHDRGGKARAGAKGGGAPPNQLSR